MDSLYFPLFLVVMAVFVIWLYYRSSRAYEKREDDKIIHSRKRKSAARKNQVAHSRPAKHAPSAGSASSPNKIWANRRRHASHSAPVKEKPHDDSRNAPTGHPGPYPVYSASGGADNSIRDQEVPEADYVGFDEYLAQQRATAAKRDTDDAGEFTMSAIKYEQSEIELEEEEAEKKRSGFRP